MTAARIALSPQSHLPELVGCIYEAALEPARWQAFLERFGAALQSPACVIWANDFAQRTVELDAGFGSLGVNLGIDAAALDSFARHYCQCNVWLQDPSLHRAGTVVHSSALFPDPQLPGTEWYGDWLQPQDLFYSCAAVVENQDERSFNVTAVRSRRQGAYTPEELALVGQLMPHLQTAFALHRKLHRTLALSQASLAVLDGLPLGVVLLDARGDILHANRRAQALVQQTGLLALGARRLHASLPADDRWLQQALHACVATGAGAGRGLHAAAELHAGQARRLQGVGGQPLQVQVAPLPLSSQAYGVQCAALVLLSDPSLVLQSLSAALRQFYGLTAAEARLAQALVNGQTLQEVADSQQLSIHTVRAQFKAAALKVGVSRQADFVRVILMGPALLRWQQEAA